MLNTIVVILVVMWLLGMVTSFTMGGLLHILLVIAIIVFLVNFISGRRSLQDKFLRAEIHSEQFSSMKRSALSNGSRRYFFSLRLALRDQGWVALRFCMGTKRPIMSFFPGYKAMALTKLEKSRMECWLLCQKKEYLRVNKRKKLVKYLE